MIEDKEKGNNNALRYLDIMFNWEKNENRQNYFQE